MNDSSLIRPELLLPFTGNNAALAHQLLTIFATELASFRSQLSASPDEDRMLVIRKNIHSLLPSLKMLELDHFIQATEDYKSAYYTGSVDLSGPLGLLTELIDQLISEIKQLPASVD